MDRDQSALLDELQRLYVEVDALYAGASCPASTECCRFGITGRQPYLTSIEAALVERALAQRGSRKTAARRGALPLQREQPERDERACLFLDRSARCTVYATRPFGCRTFFCERASGPLPERKELRELVDRLRALAERHRLGGEHARPLERVFETDR